MKKFLRKVKRTLDPYVGKYVDKFIWKFRHLIFSDWESGYLDKNTLEHPHRKLIIETIRKRPATKSILELGAGSGINLITLSKNFSDISYSGIDINKRAVDRGLKYIRHKNILNIDLIRGEIASIKTMKTNSVDIILTDAVLMYLNTNDVQETLKEMLRVSRLGFILCEQMSAGGIYVDHWRHDYQAIIKNLAGIKKVSIKKISDEYWDGDWIKHGFIIEVDKSFNMH